MTTRITIAHSQDADDVFMFAALAAGHVGTPGITYDFVGEDIQILNDLAFEQRYEVTALSVHAYALLTDRYALTRSGASMGEADYGPMLVATSPRSIASLTGARIAVPGLRTSAYLMLRLALPEFTPVPMLFSQIMDAVQRGDADAGLLIHEGQLIYREQGFHNVFALAPWWHAQSGGLPMPLGVNAVSRALSPELQRTIAQDVRASIDYGLAHPECARVAAMRSSQHLLTPEALDRYLSMYVTKRTLHMGPEEERAIACLLNMGSAAGLLPHAPACIWAD